MGIPSYFVYIVKNHRSIIKKFEKSNNKINNLYLDCNSLIYEAINIVKFNNKNQYEEEVLNLVCKKIEFYIDIIEPNKKVFIAFDGTAPVAKLNQQKLLIETLIYFQTNVLVLDLPMGGLLCKLFLKR